MREKSNEPIIIPKQIPVLEPMPHAVRARATSSGYILEIREVKAVKLPVEPSPSMKRVIPERITNKSLNLSGMKYEIA